MNTKPLGKLYDRLTPPERFPLMVAALDRGDEAERRRLADAAPRRTYSAPDYKGRAGAHLELARLHLLTALDFAFQFCALLGRPPGAGGRESDDGELSFTAYQLRAVWEGWARFSAGKGLEAEALVRDLPGYAAARAAAGVAGEASFTPEAADAFLRGRGGADPAPRPEDVAALYDHLFARLLRGSE